MPINPPLPQRTITDNEVVHLEDHNRQNAYLNTIVEGQPGIPRGTWDALTAYNNPDIVTHEGRSYIARQASTGSAPLPDNSNANWQLLADKGAAGATTLDGLTDVDTATVAPAGGNALIFDTDTGLWVPKNLAATYQALSDKGIANGYASLDASAKVPLAQIPGGNGGLVDTDQSTTSTSYVDLTTVGPSVTLTTGTKVLVIASANTYNSGAGNSNAISVAVSGASTIAASDSTSGYIRLNAASVAETVVMFTVVTVTAGSNTFTMKYLTSAGTANFRRRNLAVIPLP